MNKYIKYFLFIFVLFCFFPVFMKAETNNYFDLPQISVNSLPTASNDTLSKVYVLDNSYYITKENIIGGTPTYLPLNENLNGVKIYVNPDYDSLYNICVNAPSGSYKAWANTTTNKNYNFKYMSVGNCGTAGMVDYGTFKRSDQNNITTCNGCSSYRSFYNKSQGWYLEYFILDSDTYITGILNIDYYHGFSLTPWTTTTTYSWEEITEEQVFRVKPEKIYVPSNNLYCYHFVDSNTLRGYTSNPVVNSDINYYDFDLNHHYRQSTGVENITNNPVCLANTTTDYLYREDIVEILIFFLIVSLFVIYLPIKILFRLFRRFN